MKQITFQIVIGELGYTKTLPSCTEDRVKSTILISLEMAKKDGFFFVDNNVIIPYKFDSISFIVEEV